ncbi:conserved hypothetical protein (plasmid) [Borreliella finlandensis]|uniref:Uncharacterized protein n=3 Tax=Borreliella TaxID=64895 RepID=A0A806CFV0_9SPIR|nr:conserved hypothetical protein [Borreliella finlandensis]
MHFKEQANSKSKETSRDLSINERITKELAEVEERERVEKQLLLEAERINEIDTLTKAHLSSHFNKEVLLAKGYTLKDIIQAQRRELVRKFVPIEQIKAIAKVSDISHIDGEILEQLVSLAKVNIKLRKNSNSNSSSIDSIKGNIVAKSEERVSLLDSNFVPINFTEFVQAISNTYKQRRIQFYENLKRHKKNKYCLKEFLMSDGITKIKEEFDKKVAEIRALMKNPQQDAGFLSNSVDFRDKNLIYSNLDGVFTSSKDKIENYPVKGYPYKRGVKLSFSADGTTELEVEAGGGDDLYGICTDIDEFTGMATVVPITNNFTGYLTFKKNGNGVNPGDKLHFNAQGELEKNGGNDKSVNTIAFSKVYKLTEELSIVLASVFGNRALKGN